MAEFCGFLNYDMVEMNYLRGPCGVIRQDGESKEGVHERCGMGSRANGVNCGVVEWVTSDTLRGWRVRSLKKVYVSPNSRGRPLGRWRDKVKQYMCERSATRGGGLDQVRRECLDRER